MQNLQKHKNKIRQIDGMLRDTTLSNNAIYAKVGGYRHDTMILIKNRREYRRYVKNILQSLSRGQY